MSTVLEQIEALVEEGDTFTFPNFSSKSQRGYPEALSEKWLVWTHRVGEVRKLLPHFSPAETSLRNGLGVRLLGNGEEHFSRAKGMLLSGLRAAALLLPDQVAVPQTPQSEDLVQPRSKRVFIVHGHDEKAKNQLEILLREMGLEPIVLHRQPDLGLTITEKFEKYSDVGYAFILLTPDDIAYPAVDDEKPDPERRKEYRARPNVIFEFGFFVAHLTRSCVCCLHTGGVVVPSDVQMVYKSYRDNVEEVAHSIRRDLKAVGYDLT